MDLSKVDRILAVNQNDIVVFYVNDPEIPDSLQGIKTLEYGETYLISSNSVPYEFCSDVITPATTTTTTTTVNVSAWTDTNFVEENISSVDLSSDGNVIVLTDHTWNNNIGRFKTLFWIDNFWNTISVEGVQAEKAVLNQDASLMVVEDVSHNIKTYAWTGEWYPDSADIVLSNVYSMLDIAIDKTGNVMAALLRNSSTYNVDVFVYLRSATNDSWTQIYQNSYSTPGSVNDNLAGVDVHYTSQEDNRLAVGITENNRVLYTSIDKTNTNYVLNFELLGVNTFGLNVKIVDNDTLLATDTSNIYLFDFTTTSNNYAANSNPATAFTSHTASLGMGDNTSGDFDAQSVGTKISHVNDGSLIISNRDSSTSITQEDIIEAFQVGVGSYPNSKALAIADNKNVIALIESISASNTHKLHLYQKQSETIPESNRWFIVGQTLTENNSYDEMGTSLGMNSAGNLIVVGAPQSSGAGSGYANIYGWNGISWVKFGESITESGSSAFGSSVSASSNGSFIAVGDPSGQKVYVYSWNGSGFSLSYSVSGANPLGSFGYSVSVSDTGFLAVGAPNETVSGQSNAGNAYLYGPDGLLISTYSGVFAQGFLGASVAINALSNVMAVGIPSDASTNIGRVDVLRINSSNLEKIGGSIVSGTANNDLFGIKLALDYLGSRVAISSIVGKYAQVYKNLGNEWSLACATIDSSIDPSIQNGFGESIALNNDGSSVFIGGTLQDSHGTNSGSIKSYAVNEESLNELYPELVGNEANELFGFSVSASELGDIVVGGSPNAGTQNAGSIKTLSYNRKIPAAHFSFRDSYDVDIPTSALPDLIYDSSISSFYVPDSTSVSALSGDGYVVAQKSELSSNQDGSNITDHGISVFNTETTAALGFISLNGVHDNAYNNVIDLNGRGDVLLALVTLDGNQYTAKVFQDSNQDTVWHQDGADIALPAAKYVSAKINVDGTRVFILTDESVVDNDPSPVTTTTTTTAGVRLMTLTMLQRPNTVFDNEGESSTAWTVNDTITLTSDTANNNFDPTDTDQIIWPNMLDIDDLGELVIIGNRNGGPLVYKWNGTNLIDITSSHFQIAPSSRNNVNVSISGDGQTFALGPVGNLEGDEYGQNGSIKIISYSKSSGLFSDINTRYGYSLNEKLGYYGLKLNYWGDRLFVNNLVFEINPETANIKTIGALNRGEDPRAIVINVSNMGHRVYVHTHAFGEFGVDERFTVFTDGLASSPIAFYALYANVVERYTDINPGDTQWHKTKLYNTQLDPPELITTGYTFNIPNSSGEERFTRTASSELGLYEESIEFQFFAYPGWISELFSDNGQLDIIYFERLPLDCYASWVIDLTSSLRPNGVVNVGHSYCSTGVEPYWYWWSDNKIYAFYETENRNELGALIPHIQPGDFTLTSLDESCTGSFVPGVLNGEWYVSRSECKNGCRPPSSSSEIQEALGGMSTEGLDEGEQSILSSPCLLSDQLNDMLNDPESFYQVSSRTYNAFYDSLPYQGLFAISNISETEDLIVSFSYYQYGMESYIFYNIGSNAPLGYSSDSITIPPKGSALIPARGIPYTGSAADKIAASNYSDQEIDILLNNAVVCDSTQWRRESMENLKKKVLKQKCTGISEDGKIIREGMYSDELALADITIGGGGCPIVDGRFEKLRWTQHGAISNTLAPQVYDTGAQSPINCDVVCNIEEEEGDKKYPEEQSTYNISPSTVTSLAEISGSTGFGKTLRHVVVDTKIYIIAGDPSYNSNDGRIIVTEYDTETETSSTLGGEILGPSQSALGTVFEVNSDCTRIVCVNTSDDSILVYDLVNSAWTQQTTLSKPEVAITYGKAISINEDGSVIAIAGLKQNETYNGGFVQVYSMVDNTWTQLGADITDSEYNGNSESFADSIDINNQGNYLLVGFPGHILLRTISGVDDIGYPNTGYVQTLKYSPAGWTVDQTLFGEYAEIEFGKAVKFFDNGTFVALSAFDSNGEDEDGEMYFYDPVYVDNEEGKSIASFFVYKYHRPSFLDIDPSNIETRENELYIGNLHLTADWLVGEVFETRYVSTEIESLTYDTARNVSVGEFEYMIIGREDGIQVFIASNATLSYCERGLSQGDLYVQSSAYEGDGTRITFKSPFSGPAKIIATIHAIKPQYTFQSRVGRAGRININIHSTTGTQENVVPDTILHADSNPVDNKIRFEEDITLSVGDNVSLDIFKYIISENNFLGFECVIDFQIVDMANASYWRLNKESIINYGTWLIEKISYSPENLVWESQGMMNRKYLGFLWYGYSAASDESLPASSPQEVKDGFVRFSDISYTLQTQSYSGRRPAIP